MGVRNDRQRAVITPSHNRKVHAVGTGDKIENKADVIKGKVKETVGQASDDPALEAEGKGDQVAGHIKQAGEKIKDAVKDILD